MADQPASEALRFGPRVKVSLNDLYALAKSPDFAALRRAVYESEDKNVLNA